jgi:hypothetical protein
MINIELYTTKSAIKDKDDIKKLLSLKLNYDAVTTQISIIAVMIADVIMFLLKRNISLCLE